MEIVVGLIRPDHRLMSDVLAATGLRRSEVVGLRGKDLDLDGAEPYIAVRQRVRREEGTLKAGKTKTPGSIRDVPISWEPSGRSLADKLRALNVAPDAFVFPGRFGGPLDPDGLQRKVLRPALEEAGLPSGEGRRPAPSRRTSSAGRRAARAWRCQRPRPRAPTPCGGSCRR